MRKFLAVLLLFVSVPCFAQVFSKDNPIFDSCRHLLGEQATADCETKIVLEKRAAEEAAKETPAGQLKGLYRAYLAVKNCFEVRKEYKVPYVTKEQFEAARIAAHKKEQALLEKYPALAAKKDAIWESETQKMTNGYGPTNYNNWLHNVCQGTVVELIRSAPREQIRKDF